MLYSNLLYIIAFLRKLSETGNVNFESILRYNTGIQNVLMVEYAFVNVLGAVIYIKNVIGNEKEESLEEPEQKDHNDYLYELVKTYYS